MSFSERLKHRLIDLVRRGPRTVLWPSELVNFGNLLYLWLQAARRQWAGEDVRVRATAPASKWRAAFPEIWDHLVLPGADVRFSDLREHGDFQRLGRDYDRAAVQRFCTDYVNDAPGVVSFQREADDFRVQDTSTIVVNVRRGDYYSNPEINARYGFDVLGYLSEALRRLPVGGIERVHLISDDLSWCRTNLASPVASLGAQLTAASNVDPIRDFALLTMSRRLIITNSTFSYWGAYAASTRFADSLVVAPRFHTRDWLGGASCHLLPEWNVVDGFTSVRDSPGSRSRLSPEMPGLSTLP